MVKVMVCPKDNWVRLPDFDMAGLAIIVPVAVAEAVKVGVASRTVGVAGFWTIGIEMTDASTAVMLSVSAP